jgi:hypothetical protein
MPIKEKRMYGKGNDFFSSLMTVLGHPGAFGSGRKKKCKPKKKATKRKTKK